MRRGGCLSFLILILILSVLLFIVAYKRLGGEEGFKAWLASRSLENIKRKLLQRDIDVPNEEIVGVIERAKEAVKKGKADLQRLYEAMDGMERSLRSKVTSKRVEEFLREISESISIEVEPPGR